MEFFDLGKHCCICKQRDYLPFQCDNCKKFYCNDHFHEHQECGVKKQNVKVENIKKIDYIRCSLCKKESIVKCKGCKKDYCLDHRYEFEHSCNKVKPKEESSVSSCIIS